MVVGFSLEDTKITVPTAHLFMYKGSGLCCYFKDQRHHWTIAYNNKEWKGSVFVGVL